MWQLNRGIEDVEEGFKDETKSGGRSQRREKYREIVNDLTSS